MTCLLCDHHQLNRLSVASNNYFICQHCDLTFLDPDQRLSLSDEQKRYEQHQNNVQDQGYQNFVKPLFDVVIKNRTQNQIGLDYGSGKDSAISYLLQKNKYKINKYDPFFLNDSAVLKENFYDYIIACEVAEHFYNPKLEIAKIKSYLKKDGFLFIMTSLLTEKIYFETWSYRRDSTHVCFYSEKSCQVIADQFGFKSYSILDDQVIIFS